MCVSLFCFFSFVFIGCVGAGLILVLLSFVSILASNRKSLRFCFCVCTLQHCSYVVAICDIEKSFIISFTMQLKLCKTSTLQKTENWFSRPIIA